jgi:hypothetical protein
MKKQYLKTKPVSEAAWNKKIQMDLRGADYNETLVTYTQKVSISNCLSSRHSASKLIYQIKEQNQRLVYIFLKNILWKR